MISLSQSRTTEQTTHNNQLVTDVKAAPVDPRSTDWTADDFAKQTTRVPVVEPEVGNDSGSVKAGTESLLEKESYR
jgi:hypothetical protein